MTNEMKDLTPEKNASEKVKKKKRGCFTGCLCGLFKFSLWTILVVVAVWLCVYLIVDRKIKKFIVTDDLRQEVDWKHGEAINYNALYNAWQEEDLNPIESNGWTLLLRALGPRVLGRSREADSIPWEEFPTNEKTAEWFKSTWTPLCETYKIDPNARPTMIDHMDALAYLVKNGVKGDEELDDDSLEAYHNAYYDNYELKKGKITQSRANDVYTRLYCDDWTQEDFPVAVQWLRENEEYFKLVSEAVRSDKFYLRKPLDDDPKKGGLDVSYCGVAERGIGRDLKIRLRYNVGIGNIDAAIDDVETLAVLGRKMIDSKSSLVSERLVGVAILGYALGQEIDANRQARPTAEQRDRLRKIWDEVFDEESIKRRVDLANDSNIVETQSLAEFTALRFRNYDYPKEKREKLEKNPDFRPASYEFPLYLLSRLLPVNDPKAVESFRNMQLTLLDADDPEATLEKLKNERKWYNGHFWDAVALRFFSDFDAVAAMEREAVLRVECCANLARISQALEQYCDEKGALPPTSTVDAEGRPLQSWRVLILPYLGDEARALYEKIRLDEPWDSDFNRQFHAQIPDVYRCPAHPDADEGETVYAAVMVKDGLFDKSGVGADLNAKFARDDRITARQIMVAEKKEPVCWMRPDAEIDLTDVGDENDFAHWNDPAGEGRRALFAPIAEGERADDGKRVGHVGGCNTIDAAGGARFISPVSKTDEVAAAFWGATTFEKAPDALDDLFKTEEDASAEAAETVVETTEDAQE